MPDWTFFDSLFCFLIGMLVGCISKPVVRSLCSSRFSGQASPPLFMKLLTTADVALPFRLIVPFISGTLFLLSYLCKQPDWPQLVHSFILISLCLLVSLTDVLEWRIPNILLVIYFLLFALFFLIQEPPSWSVHLLGAACGILLFIVTLPKPDWLGMGDSKLLVLIGFALGFREVLQSLLLASCLSLAAILFMPGKSEARLTCLPFAPFLAAGAILTDLCGRAI